MLSSSLCRCASVLSRVQSHTLAPSLVASIRCLSSSTHAANSTPGSPLQPKWNAPSTRQPFGQPGDYMWGFLADTAKQSVAKTSESAESLWKQRENVVPDLPRPHNAYTGRSVLVTHVGVSAAFGRLRRILTANRVIKELRMTERHEKKGDKRRRLKSERWRRRFAHEVRKKVQLVNEIRARGS